MEKLVAITACPTGIAHTIMAAEALRRVAAMKGHDLRVETQGSEGVKTPLSDDDIAAAGAVILAADIQVDESRFEGKPGSNPEEMIGAALAGCYSMALSLGLEKGGITPESITTSAKVHLEKDGEGFAIPKIELSTEIKAAGDAEKIKAIAEETKKQCPVSKALKAVDIALEIKVAS